MSEQGSGTGDTASRIQRDISGAVAQLGFGEKFAVLGAVGVLAVWLLFDLILDGYWVGHLPFALALVVGYSAYRYHIQKTGAWAIPYATVVFGGAALIGIIGAYSLISELRSGVLDAGASRAIGALGYWAASIIAGIGALQMKLGGGKS